jgi:hypothetical protein
MGVRRQTWLLAVGVAASTLAVVGYSWLRLVSTRYHYDSQFSAITLGMSRAEVEGLLGQPTKRPYGDAGLRVIGFRDVDLPELGRVPTPHPVRVYWYDGRDRCIYVEFATDKVWRAKLFGPGSEKEIFAG